MALDSPGPKGHPNSIDKGPVDFLDELGAMSAIEEMQAIAQAEAGVVSLVPGIPSFPTAPHIRDGVHDAIDRGLTDRYTAGHGIVQLREAIAEKVKRVNGIRASIDCVMVTHGAVQGLMAVLTALIEPTDDVIILSPCFADHITQVRIASRGSMPTFVPLTETRRGWFLDPGRLESSISQRTKAILFSNPCNPTGKSYSATELSAILQIAQKFGLLIIVDEMYEYFTYDANAHTSIASLPGAGNRVISIYGTSKTYAMSGWRVGYVVASEELIASIFKVHDVFVTCPTAASQYAALAALTGRQEIIDTYRSVYEQRRGLVIERLVMIDGMDVISPDGAYYVFPRLTNMYAGESGLALRLIREAKVAVVPGHVFGPGGESHIRISFAGEDSDLREGLNRLVRFFQEV